MRHLYDSYNNLKHQIRDVESLLVAHRQQVSHGPGGGLVEEVLVGRATLLAMIARVDLVGSAQVVLLCCMPWLFDQYPRAAG